MGTKQGSGGSADGRKKRSIAAPGAAADAAPGGTADADPREVPPKRQLIAEIRGKLKELGEEDLQFLVKQVDVLLFNKGVREANQRLVETSRRKKPAEAAGKTARKVELFKRGVEIRERSGGEFFVIVVDGSGVFFNLEEMRCIAGICRSAESERVSAERLFRWFRKERSDFLKDGGIADSASPSLLELHRLVISRYTVKKS